MSTLHLRSAPSVLLSLLGLLSSASAAEPAIGRYATMDHGPCYAGTIVQPDHVCSNKGLVIALDPQRQALAVFDTELLRFSYGALHASLHFPSGRDGLEGQPNVEGDVVFAASTSTGWARPGSGDFADPRDRQKSDQHLGALPMSWGRYEGLFLHQDQVVLSYRVGATQMLEVPGLENQGRISAITRNLTLSGNTQALTLLVGEREGARVGVVDGLGLIEDDAGILAAGVVGNGTFASDGSRLVLSIPGGTPAVKLLVWRGARDDLPAFKALLNASHMPVDAHALITGGPGRWGPPLTTVGELGHEDGPYVVDTIAVPYDNPSGSYMRLSGHDFFADGRAAVCTIDGDVWIVSGIDAGLAHLSWRRFATGLFQPLGLRIVDGNIYVLCRDRIVRLRDIDGDGEADWYESFNADCPVTRYYHEFAMDLVTDREGNFYYNKGSNLGEAANDAQGCVLKVSRDGSTLTTYCTGMREANGMGGGDGYPLLNSDNQGNWMPVCRINQLKEGGFYGFMGAAHRDPKPATYDPPLIWTHYPLDNSTGGLTYVDHPGWGPFQDKPIGVSYGKSSMFILLPEEVDGVPQAGAIYLPARLRIGRYAHAL